MTPNTSLDRDSAARKKVGYSCTSTNLYICTLEWLHQFLHVGTNFVLQIAPVGTNFVLQIAHSTCTRRPLASGLPVRKRTPYASRALAHRARR